MAQAMAEEGGRVPMSPGLQATLLRARDYAASQSQPQVVLEHLLLALTEDADAAHVLEASQIDIGRLRHDVAGFIGAIQERGHPGTPSSPAISPALTQVLKYATLAAQQGRRASIDGAIVLAALIGDGRSMAASFLKAQGLTFEAAIKALREATPRPPAPHPVAQHAAPLPERPADSHHAPQSREAVVSETSSTTPRAEDMLAAARERIVNRTAQSVRTAPPRESQPVVATSAAAPNPPATSTPEPEMVQSSAAPRPDIAATITPQALVPAPAALTPLPALAPTADPAQPMPAPPAKTAPPIAALPVTQPPVTQPQVTQPPVSGPPRPPQQPIPQRLQLPPPSAWAPPPSAPQSAGPGMQAYRPAGPAPPPGWTGRPPGQPPHAPQRGPLMERPAANAPWPEPSQPPNRESRPAPVEPLHPQRPVMAPPAPSAGTSGALVEPSRGPAIDPSQIAHNIPARLTRGRAQVIEVRVERPPLAGGGGGQRPHALRAETVVARAIAVRLRPVAGRFVVDAASPETQWDQGGGGSGAGRLASEAAVWRFTVTPLASGRGVLQLAVSARTMGADGVLAETQLPDQTFDVRAAPNIRNALILVAQIALVALMGELVFKAAEVLLGVDIYKLVRKLFV